VHDAPDPAKIAALSEFLAEIGIPGVKLAKGQVIRPRHFNEILRKVAGTPYAALVPQLILRSQAQAIYSPTNIGHFGLALRHYAHFTSPIRRYADLLVHRALLGDAQADTGRDQLEAVSAHISATERRAAEAERAGIDRYRATLLAGSVGSLFTADISGVASFGLFVKLRENSADGLVPISTLPGDYYVREERAQRLVGRNSGRVYRLGAETLVRLVEADGIGGRLVFRIEEENESGAASARRIRRGPGRNVKKRRK
jgi:ribonuclease R